MDTATVDAVLKAVQQLGFPIIVALWFMWRTDKKLDRLADLMAAHIDDKDEVDVIKKGKKND